jgi:hypothetical protein
VIAVVGPVWKPLSGRGFVYVFLISEGATTTLAAAGSRLFPAGLGWRFFTTTAATMTWDWKVDNERQTDTGSHKE